MGIKTKGGIKTAPGPIPGGVKWDDAPTEFLQRCAMMSIWGPTGTGRTRLALSAPGPIAFLHAGEKVQGIVQRTAAQKTVKIINFGGSFSGSEQDIANQAGPVWNRLYSGVLSALKSDYFRTVIIDTDTEAWELLRLASFGVLNPKGRIDSNYGPVNAIWRSMFKTQRAAYAEGESKGLFNRPNLILIGQCKDEYIKTTKSPMGERTGKLLQAGQKDVPYNADIILETGFGLDGSGFTATVRKGWFNAGEWNGAVLTDEDIDFCGICAAITGTEVSEWQ